MGDASMEEMRGAGRTVMKGDHVMTGKRWVLLKIPCERNDGLMWRRWILPVFFIDVDDDDDV